MDLHGLPREDYLALADDERPHLYPDRAPSNSTYVGTKNQPGCRCIECRAEHAKATRKGRQVIQLEPESVTDRPIPAGPAASEPEQPVEAQAALPEVSAEPQPSEAVYSEPVTPPTAEEIAKDMLKLAARVAESNGGLPTWMISATEIASRYGVPVNVGQAATRINKEYIRVDPYLRRLKLVKRVA